jgi:hypothetical protein
MSVGTKQVGLAVTLLTRIQGGGEYSVRFSVGTLITQVSRGFSQFLHTNVRITRLRHDRILPHFSQFFTRRISQRGIVQLPTASLNNPTGHDTVVANRLGRRQGTVL